MKTIYSKLLLLLLCFIGVYSLKANSPEINMTNQQKKASYIISELDVKPTFKGGHLGDFKDWIYDNLSIPKKISEKQSNTTIWIYFQLDENGKIINIEPKTKINKYVREIIKVIESAPNWTPGKKEGQNVIVDKMSVPVTYRFASIRQQEQTKANSINK